MATLQAVQYSMNGEPLQKNKLGKDFAGLVTYPVEKKDGKVTKVIYPEPKAWHIFKLVDSNKQGGVRLPSIDDVMNPATGKVERVRLLSGVDSIWLKDQKDLPKDYEKTNWVELRFFRGTKILRVAGTNTSMLEFLRVTNNNIGNPIRVKGGRHEFFEYDSAIAEKEAFEREDYELNMAIAAKQTPFVEMKKHAALLGIRLISELGEPIGEDGIRKQYVMYAKRMPDHFDLTRKNTQLIEINWLVKRGIAEGLIDIGREPQKIFWSKGGGYIGVYPQGKNPEEYLTELALTNSEDGIRFKEQLKQVVA